MATSGRDQFFGHPRGLMVLFFTEMWERFSYYGMRALLVLYMVNYFKWTQQDASMVYKWYTSLVYLTPLLGGFLADRFLGNKWAIVVGASLMSIGHFCMAFEQVPIFYMALVFLILGNGFFKPNMSTQVGRLYSVGDPRRDGAYTIFYMGINLGAFLSPIVCGALANGTKWGYHAGFAAAGVGMVIGLVTYLSGLRWVHELPVEAEYTNSNASETARKAASHTHYMTEAEAETTHSVIPHIARFAPVALTCAGLAAVAGSALLWATGVLTLNNAVALGLGGGFASFMSAWIVRQLKMAVRDRVLAILALAVFVVFFWAAFEQAGNAMNIFADKITDRYVTQQAPEPSIYPPPAEAEIQGGVIVQLKEALAQLVRFNPMTAESFQSVNPLAIFLFAPLVAWLWIWLPRRGFILSIPAKMAIGLFLQGLAFALLIWSANAENKPSATHLVALPAGVWQDEGGRVVFRDAPELDDEKGQADFNAPGKASGSGVVVSGGRLKFDAGQQQIQMNGVLSDTDRDRMLRATVPKSWLLAVRKLADETHRTKMLASGGTVEAAVDLQEIPPGFDLRFSGFEEKSVRLDAERRRLVSTVVIADRDYKMLLLAGAEPGLRDALNRLYVTSARFKVSVWWLVWFYILCTLGELCLSPVGLSMVSKLAPARFATMLMGMWYLTSFFGNFAAGLAGEVWGTVTPLAYFTTITVALGAASFLCFLAIRKVVSMMHGVN